MIPLRLLPSRLLAVTQAGDFERIISLVESFVPILGVGPAPKETVICYFGSLSEFTPWTVHHDGRETWVTIERGRSEDVTSETDRIVAETMALGERYYPDRGIVELDPVNAPPTVSTVTRNQLPRHRGPPLSTK